MRTMFPSRRRHGPTAELTKTMRIVHTSLTEPKARFGDERGHLFLVADGMGGHRAGEQASALAVVAIEQFTLNTFKWFFHADGADAQRVLTQFQAALRQADARILEESAEHPELSGMGTTLTMAYCLSMKRLMVLDCMVIASGFVLRVVGGAVAIAVVPTHWLIACAFLLALFLAFSKRRQELLTLSESATAHRKVLGQYSIAYLEQVNIILIGAAVVSYALYTVAPETIERFGTDALIYGTVFVIYGMLRYLALINNPENGGNPSKMLLQDRPLWITVVAWSFYNVAVIYHFTLW